MNLTELIATFQSPNPPDRKTILLALDLLKRYIYSQPPLFWSGPADTPKPNGVEFSDLLAGVLAYADCYAFDLAPALRKLYNATILHTQPGTPAVGGIAVSGSYTVAGLSAPPTITPTEWLETAIAADDGALNPLRNRLTATPTHPTDAPASDGLVTVFYRGGQSYALSGKSPIKVSQTEHNLLQAFLKAGEQALDTADLTKVVENPSRECGNLEKKLPGAIRRPRGKGTGFFIRVRQALHDTTS